MPSAPGYVRNIAQEDKTAKARGDDVKNALRHKDRRKALKLGLVKPGEDLDHANALSMGGKAGDKGNWRAETEHANRSFPRNSDGSMKRNVEATLPGHDKK